MQVLCLIFFGGSIWMWAAPPPGYRPGWNLLGAVFLCLALLAFLKAWNNDSADRRWP